jgi:uncharacterized protein (DUF488 family)
VISTIGHSTRSWEAFLLLLEAHRITHLADVRTVPRSRRHPHFAGAALSASLADAGISYRHFPGLGGLRKPRPGSENSVWRNESFRGYADYMQTPAFGQALDELLEWVMEARSDGRAEAVMMCAEAVWWRCHRQLIADALVAGGIEVRHIMSPDPALSHALTPFARVEGRRVSYASRLV